MVLREIMLTQCADNSQHTLVEGSANSISASNSLIVILCCYFHGKKKRVTLSL